MPREYARVPREPKLGGPRKLEDSRKSIRIPPDFRMEMHAKSPKDIRAA